MIKSISDIKHALYINLDTRPDRKELVEKEFKNIGIHAERFKAIKMPNGALGCSMSHLKCIELAKSNDWDHVLIVEDDILFLQPNTFITNFNRFLSNYDSWDVVLIAGNNVAPYKTVDPYCVQVNKCQTTTGYLVKKHYYDTLIQNFREGINLLLREPSKHVFYAIDKYWFKLQEKDKWYLITPLTVTQRPDYSDIEKKPTNYTKAMISLDKPYLFTH